METLESMSLEEEGKQMLISEAAIDHLEGTARWGKFLSIMGFILIGFMAVSAMVSRLIFSSLFDQAGQDVFNDFGSADMADAFETAPSFFTFVTLIFILLYFIPTWRLFKFSTDTLSACRSQNPALLESAFKQQKFLYQFIGIIALLLVGTYVLLALIILIGLGVGVLL